MKENTEVVQFNFLIYPVRKKAQSRQSKSERQAEFHASTQDEA